MARKRGWINWTYERKRKYFISVWSEREKSSSFLQWNRNSDEDGDVIALNDWTQCARRHRSNACLYKINRSLSHKFYSNTTTNVRNAPLSPIVRHKSKMMLRIVIPVFFVLFFSVVCLCLLMTFGTRSEPDMAYLDKTKRNLCTEREKAESFSIADNLVVSSIISNSSECQEVTTKKAHTKQKHSHTIFTRFLFPSSNTAVFVLLYYFYFSFVWFHSRLLVFGFVHLCK